MPSSKLTGTTQTEMGNYGILGQQSLQSTSYFYSRFDSPLQAAVNSSIRQRLCLMMSLAHCSIGKGECTFQSGCDILRISAFPNSFLPHSLSMVPTSKFAGLPPLTIVTGHQSGSCIVWFSYDWQQTLTKDCSIFTFGFLTNKMNSTLSGSTGGGAGICGPIF